MMDRLACMRVFRRVVEREGFSAAGRDLGLSNGAVSKQVGQLERLLGVRLLNRTTRRLSLTEAGRDFYARAVRILDEVEEAMQAMQRIEAAPRGRLRVNAPMSLGLLHLATLIPEFMARYPDVEIDLVMNDRVIDLVEEGFDLALRAQSALPDSSLVARRLAPIRRVVCAAPAYLQARGVPEAPADLMKHECLIYTLSRQPLEWRLGGPGGPHRIRVAGRYHANNSHAIREALIAGMGISLTPTFAVGDDLRSGRLRRVLEAFPAETQTLYAVHAHGSYMPAKLRVFIDFLAARLGPVPPWDRNDAGPRTTPNRRR